jgi:glycosyltransferase involved in cell wall biosynthesis
VTIHKGHDPAWYSGTPPASLAGFGIPAGATVVGFTGNMRPVKGVDVLIEAARQLPSSPPIHFLLVGEVRDSRIERLARDARVRDRLHFTGFRKDAPALAGACDIFVMPSVEREGLPRSLIEAMAQGVAPVVSDVGGMPELVAKDECGLVVPPRDPQALAQAILALAQDPVRRQAFGRRARVRIETDFHIRHTIEKAIALFREAAAAPA